MSNSVSISFPSFATSYALVALFLFTASVLEPTAVTASNLYTSAAGRLYLRGALGPSSGNAWTDVGALPGSIVNAMTYHIDTLYAVSGGKLWKRNMNTAGWMDLGAITAGTATSQVTAITSHFRNNQQQLVISKGDNIYALENGVWTDIGLAFGITGLVSSRAVRTAGMLNDTLYVTTLLNQICKRFGTGIGNTWECYEDSAYGIKGATILDGELFVAGSDDKIFKRGTVGVGPNTGNAWIVQGDVFGPTSLAAATTFLGCNGGYRWDSSSSSCVLCGAGTWSIGGLSSSCTSCSDGRTSPVGSSSAAACTPCPAGRYKNSTTNGICQLCPAGYASATGQSVCTICSPGSYSAVQGSSSCTSCAAGQFSTSSGATSCTACSKGTYTNTAGNIVCKPCPDNQFAPNTGATSCTNCQAGTSSSGGAWQCCSRGSSTCLKSATAALSHLGSMIQGGVCMAALGTALDTIGPGVALVCGPGYVGELYQAAMTAFETYKFVDQMKQTCEPCQA